MASHGGVGGATREIRGGHGATTFPFFIDVGDRVLHRFDIDKLIFTVGGLFDCCSTKHNNV